MKNNDGLSVHTTARRRSGKFAVLTLLGALLCSCKGEQTPASAAIVVTNEQEAPKLPPGFSGITVHIGEGVQYMWKDVSSAGGGHESQATLNGLPFSVEGTTVHIGTQSYGPFAQGAAVKIQREGVFVDGKSHGALP